MIQRNEDQQVWGPYPNYDDIARFQTSLRCVAREIPPVFGSFWPDSAK